MWVGASVGVGVAVGAGVKVGTGLAVGTGVVVGRRVSVGTTSAVGSIMGVALGCGLEDCPGVGVSGASVSRASPSPLDVQPARARVAKMQTKLRVKRMV